MRDIPFLFLPLRYLAVERTALKSRQTIGHERLDLPADPGETKNVAAEHRDVVKRLKGIAEVFRQDLGDASTQQLGSGRRPPGRVDDPATPAVK